MYDAMFYRRRRSYEVVLHEVWIRVVVKHEKH